MSTNYTSIKNLSKLLLVTLPVLLLIYGCKKEEGTGGLATIRGKVFAYDVNEFGDQLDSGYLGDVRVFISYGDHTWVDDDVRTSYNGEYAFEWLQKGWYKIWVLSDCDTCNLLQTEDLEIVNVSSKRETCTRARLNL